ncbi:hypothetical protein ACI2L1_23445 [Streptomyces sp. NPDC019531]|uniref:hypothetical protein n=1 Tax=Streptomyces sp. NPDC019531 TaxID=3365062 RepID=UPI00384E9CDE
MSQLEMYGVASALAGGAWVVLGVLWWVRDRADRRAVARLDPARIDPYHAVATAGVNADADRAAGAVLLAAGLVRVTDDGRVEVTERGADPGPETPEHPLPAAVLAALSGHDGPWSLKELVADGEHRGRRDAFLRAEDARWPRWSSRRTDRLLHFSLVPAVLFSGWSAFELLNRGHVFSYGGGGFVMAVLILLWMWTAFTLILGWAVAWVWPFRRDRFAPYCRALLPHPAERDLDAVQRAELDRAWAYRPPLTEADHRVESWVDSGGAF